MWDNFLLISTQIGDFAQALMAIEQLLELNKKGSIDELPLEIISKELLTVVDDEKENPLRNLRKKLLGILARVNSRQTMSSNVCISYINFLYIVV